jgi:hypothetical protein
MATLNYKEIYYTSSERSIITHSAGFGIRTYTNGMDSQEASTIAERCVMGYSLDDNRKLTFEQIQQNPKVVYDYPPTYIFHKVTLDNGVVRYVLGRTIYIGIDYGYFCNRDEAMRTGTNYFTHLLVFDEIPPVSILAYIGSKNFFAPADYTCAPDNEELKLLMTGEPQLLSPKRSQIEDSVNFNVSTDLARCIVGLLQSYSNTLNNKDDSLRKIIIKAPAAKTPELIKGMAMLPQKLVEGNTFQSNYMQGYGVPDEFKMIFVNEFNKNELYENNHICIDLFNNTTVNVDDNFIFQKIVELSNDGDSTTIQRLIKYYLGLNLTSDLNYQFLYNLFIAIDSDKDVPLEDISKDFISQLSNTHLAATQEAELWRKLNRTINTGLTSKKSIEINRAINAVKDMLPTYKKQLEISQESTSWITTVVLGTKSYLGQLVNTNNVEIIIALIDRTKILSDNDLYNALKQSHDATVWMKFIKFYYADNLSQNIVCVIDNILSVEMPSQWNEDLIKGLFPIENYQNELFSYILNHTSRISELAGIVKTICLNSRQERFSSMLSHSNNNPGIVRILSPMVQEYFGKLVDADANSGMKEVLSFVDKVSVDTFNMMNATELFDKYIRVCLDNPLKESKKIIDSILSLNVNMSKATVQKYETLNSLFESEVPKKVDVEILHAAHKMNKRASYIRDLYEAWLKTSPSSQDLRNYINGVEDLSADVTEELILATWESRIRDVRDNREKYVLIISDNSNWSGRDKKAFVKTCRDQDLVRHLTDSDKLIKKIIRKIINLLHK